MNKEILNQTGIKEKMKNAKNLKLMNNLQKNYILKIV